MIAHYGYRDGSGEFFISINTDDCNGCGDCVTGCPCHVFEVGQDTMDPFRDVPVASVREEFRNKLKYICAPCKPLRDRPQLPCIEACGPKALNHSW
ncbi:MAG: ferredoxin [Thermodesulfobacteriota bacterium]